MIRVELHGVEWLPDGTRTTGCYKASACGITVDLEEARRGAPICKLARKLVNAGHDPDEWVECYRDGKLAIMAKPLWQWAAINIEEADNVHQSAKVVILRERPYFSPEVNACIARARDGGEGKNRPSRVSEG